MIKNLLIVLTGLFALHTSVVSAGVTVLDFEGFANGQIIDDEYAANGVNIVTDNARKTFDYGVAFDTSLSGTEDPDLEFNNSNNDYTSQYTALNLGGYAGNTTPGNILIIQENNTGCGDGICNSPDDEGGRPAGYFEFNFSDIVSILSIDFFDVEDQNLNNAYNAIHFYDASDNEIYANNFVPFMGDGQFMRQTFNDITGVKRLVINLPGSGGIDNLAFKTTDVPEPGTLVIMASALLFGLRRKLN
jgi:hypothetical protein